MADLVITNARILDGSGQPPRPGFVAVSGPRIEAVGGPASGEPPAARRVEARGMTLAPGFIDVHSHSDVVPLIEPEMDSAIRQGITTVVVGNCGVSGAPPPGDRESALLAGVDPDELEMGWTTFAGYLDRIDAARPAVNVTALVGHGSIRRAVMGSNRRGPNADELGRMQGLLEEALESGAVGLSTGLVYAPGIWATTDEIVALAKVVARLGGIYASHIRGEGELLFDAVAEAIHIGRRAGCPSHISHLKTETESGWGRAGELLETIEAARRTGAEISADQYPYTAYETTLDSVLPPSCTAAELPDVLADAEATARLRRVVEEGGEAGFQSSIKGVGWERLVVMGTRARPSAIGRSIAQVAAELGTVPFEAAMQLLLADPTTSIIGHAMVEDDVRTILAEPDVMVGSDGLAVSPMGPLGRYSVHPRYYGTFPRVLGPYVRQHGVLTLEAAVRKMTSLAADRFGLVGRGRIEPGAFADLVLFDPERIRDTATYERPHSFPDGIDLVVVNGRVAWPADGSSQRAGRALRHGT